MEDDYEDQTADTSAPEDTTSGGLASAPASYAAIDKQIGDTLGILQQAARDLKTRRVGPSEAEKWFSIAAALGKPTRTGSFGESLGNVNEALLQYKKGQREAKAEKEDLLQKYGLQDIQLQGQRLTNLARMQTAQAAATRAGMPKFQQAFTDPKSGKVLGVWVSPNGEATTKEIAQISPEQKVIGVDTKSGQVIVGNPSDPTSISSSPIPGYTPPAREYSAQERTALLEGKSAIDNGKLAVRNIDKALGLNEKAYEGAFAGPGVSLARLTGIGKDTAATTSQMQMLMDTQVMSSLRSTFGGNPTEGEREFLRKASGFTGMTRAERAALLREGRDLAVARMRNQTSTIQGIQGGGFGYRPSAAPAAASGAPTIKILSRRPVGE